jgi:uncharacterized protein (TIGR03067 family)
VKARIFIALAAAFLVAADDEAVTKERKLFKGQWELVAATSDGQKLEKAMLGDQTAVFDGMSYKQLTDDKVVEEGDFEIDPKADPKTIDFVIKKGPDEGKRQLGLYKFDGKTLTLSLARPGDKERPKTLESKPGSTVALLVFEREEDEKGKKDKDK